MGATVKIREKFQVTIPEEVRGKLPLKVGERVEIIVRDGEIVIRPFVEVPRQQAWFWGTEWQEQIAASLENVKKGKVQIFKTASEARKSFGD